jgi:hypothetical protein
MIMLNGNTYILGFSCILWVFLIKTITTIPKIQQCLLDDCVTLFSPPFMRNTVLAHNIFFLLSIPTEQQQSITYQLDPWGSQGPRHTQQKSAWNNKTCNFVPTNLDLIRGVTYITYFVVHHFTLQLLFLHTMWLHPPFFSIVTRHFGHS